MKASKGPYKVSRADGKVEIHYPKKAWQIIGRDGYVWSEVYDEKAAKQALAYYQIFADAFMFDRNLRIEEVIYESEKEE